MEPQKTAESRLHPLTAVVNFFHILPKTFVTPVIFVAVTKQDWVTIFVILGSVAAVILFFFFIQWLRTSYVIDAEAIIVRSGVISTVRRTIPIEKLQDVEIEQLPFHRLFGLARLTFETGSGGKDEAILDSIKLSEADLLRRTLLAHTALVADKKSDAAPEAVFSMPPSRILMLGLFEFSTLSIVAALISFYGMAAAVYEDKGDKVSEWGLAERHVLMIVENGWLLETLLLLACLTVAFSVGRTALAEHGYTLSKEERGLRRKRGLLSRSEVLIPVHRIKSALVSGGLIRSRYGWYDLSLQTLGGGDDAGGNQAAAPLAQWHEIARILENVPHISLPPNDGFEPVSSLHAPLTLVGLSVSLLIPLVIAASVWPLLWWVASLYAPVAALIWLGAKRLKWLADDRSLWVRSGVWTPRTMIVPINSIQSLAIEQGIIQRRLGLATLQFDTAGGGAAIHNLDEARARSLCAELTSLAWPRDGAASPCS